jgi:hypothetical protein
MTPHSDVIWRVATVTAPVLAPGAPVTLPDLSVFGLPPISGVSASWDVTGLGPAKTIDD